MPNSILVPLDGSDLSERVLPWLSLLLSVRPEAKVELLRCYEPPSTIYLIPELAIPTTAVFSEDNLHGAFVDYLKVKAGELGLSDVETTVVMGDAPTEILERSEKQDLVLMASHGRGGIGRWLMGSVATKVTRGATVPVLVVGGRCMQPDASHPAKIQTIMVAYDGSPASERALYQAGKLARDFGAKLFIYQAVVQVAMTHPVVVEANRADIAQAITKLDALAKTLEGVVSHAEVREASSSTGIVEYADEISADLLVIGSHGKSGLARWMIGSETEGVLQEAHCPVLVTH